MASDEDRSQIRALLARRVALLAGAFAVALALGVAAYGVVVIRTTQQSNVPKIDNTAETLKLVKDCVLPDGKCFKRGQAQTAVAVGDISVRQIAAVACADQPGTQTAPQIKACVDRTVRVLAAANPGRKP